MMSHIIIYGASGHGKVVAATAQSCDMKIDGFLDDNSQLANFMNLKVEKKYKKGTSVFIGIGNNKIRKKIVAQSTFPIAKAIIDSSALVRTTKQIGEGTLIAAAAVIQPDAVIGKHAIINTSSVIEHDCVIEDFVHVSPNATLSGNVVVGEGTHIGSGATVIPGIKIGKWCIIGAGSVVIKDIPDHAIVVGNPGRIIKVNE